MPSTGFLISRQWIGALQEADCVTHNAAGSGVEPGRMPFRGYSGSAALLLSELTRRPVRAALLEVSRDRWPVDASDGVSDGIAVAAFIVGGLVVVARKRARPAHPVGSRADTIEQSGETVRLVEVQIVKAYDLCVRPEQWGCICMRRRTCE
jgi:hypothetical protein